MSITLRCDGCGMYLHHKTDFFELRKVTNYHGVVLEAQDIHRQQFCNDCAQEMENNLIPAGYSKKEEA